MWVNNYKNGGRRGYVESVHYVSHDVILRGRKVPSKHGKMEVP